MKSPLAPGDLFSIITVADPQLAPDGSVYFRYIQLDRAADAARSSIWRVNSPGAGVPFTRGCDDRLPRVSPDGSTLAFVAERDEKPHIYLMPTAGGEARAAGSAYEKITALAWLAGSMRLAFVASTEHDPTTARIFHDAASGARHIRALPFKSDADGLLDGTRRHVFVLDVRSAACERLTWGDFDAGAPAWAPGGARIAFSASIGLPEWSFAGDIHIVDCATKTLRTLTAGTGPMDNPAWSHDGATIAFTGHEHGDDAGGRFNTELLLVDAAGGPTASLSASLDRTVGDAIIGDLRSGFAGSPPAWSDDDRELLVQVSDTGTCGIRAFARDGSGVRTLAAGERDIFGFTARAGSIALAFSTPEIPADIVLLAADGTEQRLTALNDRWLAEKSIVTPLRHRPAADDGTILDAWLLTPAGPPGPLPLVLQIHGGPHVAYGYSFFFEFQMLAGTGCAVAYGNPRGAQSYGHRYADAITGDWGGIDAADVGRILDGALAHGDFDRSRVGVAGGSYGGFLTTRLLGHSDRFAAGVSMRAVNDFASEVGASDLGWLLERELNAPPILGDRGQRLFDASPLSAICVRPAASPSPTKRARCFVRCLTKANPKPSRSPE